MADIVSNKVTTVELDASQASISNLVVNGGANFANSTHDSIQATEGQLGNLIVNGAARFVQPIYAEINGAKDINAVNTGSISNNSYVMFSNGTNLFRVKYSDLITDLSSKVSVTFADSEGVGY